MINLRQTILDIIPTSELNGPNTVNSVIAKLEAQGHKNVSAMEVIAVDVIQTFDPTNGSSNCFYEQAAGDWKVALSRVKDIHYAFVVYEDVVLEIYDIAHWTEKKKDERSVFRGQPILRPMICEDANGNKIKELHVGHPLSVCLSKVFSSLLDRNDITGKPKNQLGILQNPVRYYTIFFE